HFGDKQFSCSLGRLLGDVDSQLNFNWSGFYPVQLRARLALLFWLRGSPEIRFFREYPLFF
ncbi:MAG TPA: hypothetical protein PLG04_10515, partial [Anaerolineaceae bacterium]|nr:hypothetical protein [Anaerolineaceae bacterium]